MGAFSTDRLWDTVNLVTSRRTILRCSHNPLLRPNLSLNLNLNQNQNRRLSRNLNQNPFRNLRTRGGNNICSTSWPAQSRSSVDAVDLDLTCALWTLRFRVDSDVQCANECCLFLSN